MWDFMKPKPKPPKPAPGCVQSIEDWRRYILAELDCVYKRILEELSVTDPDSLSKLADIIKEYEEIDGKVAASLNLMQEEIEAFRELLNTAPEKGYEIDGVYYPDTENLVFRIKEVR